MSRADRERLYHHAAGVGDSQGFVEGVAAGKIKPLPPTVPAMPIKPDTERQLRTAGRKVAEWTTERDRLIKAAIREGGSLREVGELAGVSHTAVKFIAHGRPK